MSETAQKVINIETDDWAPSQVARWLQQEIDTGEVERVSVAVEYVKDADCGNTFTHVWSNSTCEQLWYLISWLHRRVQERYFR